MQIPFLHRKNIRAQSCIIPAVIMKRTDSRTPMVSPNGDDMINGGLYTNLGKQKIGLRQSYNNGHK